MNTTKGSITQSDEIATTVDTLLMYDEAEKQENEVNRANAEVAFQPAFIPVFPEIQRRYQLTDPEAKLYGFIWFFLSNASKRFYFTNEQLAHLLVCSEATVKRSVKTLQDKGLCEFSYRIKANGGTIRFVSKFPTGQIDTVRRVKNVPSDGSQRPAIENKIIENKINVTNVTEKSEISPVYGNSEINEVAAYFLTTMDIPKEDCTREQSRRYWNLLLRESKKGTEGVRWLIDQAREDSFYRSNITSSRDLYYKRVKIVARKRGGVMKHYDATAEVERRRLARLDRPEGDPLVTG